MLKQIIGIIRYACLVVTVVTILAIALYDQTNPNIQHLFGFIRGHILVSATILTIGGYKIYTLCQKKDRVEPSDMLKYLRSIGSR